MTESVSVGLPSRQSQTEVAGSSNGNLQTVPSQSTTGSDASRQAAYPSRAQSQSQSQSQSQFDNHSHAPVLNSTPSHSKVSTSNLKTAAYPVISEVQFGSSIMRRSTQLVNFKDLGSPDMIHIANISNGKESGQYHFINGLDVSSVEAPIAYMSSVLLSAEKNGRKKRSKKDMSIGVFCCYNCFTKGDLRIRAEFPGTISTSFVFSDAKRAPLTGDRITKQIWLETQTSAIIRSLVFNQELSRTLPGMVKLNPIASKKMCFELIDNLCAMLPLGALTGCRPTVLTPTLQNNYLNDALLTLLEISQLYDYALEKINELNSNGQYALLVVKILFLQEKEVDAVKMLHQALNANSRDGFLLLEQSSYLLRKQRPDLALISSERALSCSPTEFECWENLIQVHMVLENFKEALSILNSAPMYSTAAKIDTISVNPDDYFEFEEPFEGCIQDIWQKDTAYLFGSKSILQSVPKAELEQCDPILVRLHENAELKGTFARAYSLIANIVRIIGWDRTLNLRSKIFVMEEEMNASTVSLATGSGSGTGSGVNDLRKKVLCERWLDHLFLNLYEDLRIVVVWESDRIDNVVRHSALEWLLIGLAAIRCHHFESGIAALKTTVNSRFNYFASRELIDIFQKSRDDNFKALHEKTVYNGDLIRSKLINDEYMIRLIIRHMSYEKRYYGEFNPVLILELKYFMDTQFDDIWLKSFIAGEFNQSLRLFALTDRIIDLIKMYNT